MQLENITGNTKLNNRFKKLNLKRNLYVLKNKKNMGKKVMLTKKR